MRSQYFGCSKPTVPKMNQLPFEKRCKIIQLLVEGNSLRSCSRIMDVSINTVTRLLIRTGKACQEFHNQIVKDLPAKRVQCDEIWSFVYSKDKNTPKGRQGVGSVWTWVAMDPDTKLVICWYVGERSSYSAFAFMELLRERVKGRTQLTTDGLTAYVDAVEEAFGGDIDFAQLRKLYSVRGVDDGTGNRQGRYKGAERKIISGRPDPKKISTSILERQNLTMRMGMRRFTRKTNAFSKKIENHGHAIALHFVYNNFVRIHTTLRVPPAMEAGLIKRLMKLEDIVRLLPEEQPQKRGEYKKKKSE